MMMSTLDYLNKVFNIDIKVDMFTISLLILVNLLANVP